MNPITPAGMLSEAAKARPGQEACGFMGRSFTYSELIKMTDDCARAFAAIGVHEDSRVMIYMPMIPQALTCFYGLNMLGATAVFPELDGAGAQADIRAIVTTDSLYAHFSNIPGLPTIIIARPQDTMGGLKRLSYILTDGRGVEKISEGYGLINWEGFLQGGKALRGEYHAAGQGGRTAAIIRGQAISNEDFTRGGSPAEIARLHLELVNGRYCELTLE